MTAARVLDAATELAFKRLEEAHGDLSNLPSPMQVLVLVHSAQGVIDNGGFPYFFESDWPGSPNYETFSEAYRLVGATKSANALEKALACFTFPDPHLDQQRRVEFMKSLPGDHAFFGLDRPVVGDESIWGLLENFVRKHPEVFSMN